VAAIVWLRHDLRVRDHPALRAALARHDEVAPVFCLDDRLLHGRHASGARTQFLLECLADLDASLRERGGRLVVRRGPPERELASIAAELGGAEVHCTADVSPFGRRAEERVRGAGLDLGTHPGLTVVDRVGEVLTQQGGPYTVFSPFHRRWLREGRREVLAAPRKLALPAGIDPGAVPALCELGLRQEVNDPMRGGEGEARRRLGNFMAGPVERYLDTHDALGADRTSRLSPYLHFGCVSAREVEARVPAGQGPEAFRRQLAWRDFHHHVLLHHPRNAREEFQGRFRDGALEWEHDGAALDAWRSGRTGFPLVDAGMRQLLHEGWMHNRARLVVGSFLTKDLGIDWRAGERHFMRLLVDGDEANNNGNWQWVASVGVDPQPFYRRFYNPTRHMERYDPRGTYVRRHVPELRGVPDRYLREPWTMPRQVQGAAGCVIGRDYPEPIVDRPQARDRAFVRYRVAARGDTPRVPPG
jgi:deoxyribodipyrimidine photo-lyase